ncbi:flagellar protein FliT [Oceanobacillus salinisoli]|uniref:flagellar protein FliT n=1 Tax=Oceanobacillus salinisoli TaxID=2678611 RepID=UPI0012E2FC7C|nr:flagellar protein FliT [Oceanobacillus salinisoli]
MNRVQSIYKVTVSMKEILDQDFPTSQRESVIEQLDRLLIQRATHMEQLASPYTDEEKLLGQKLIPLNQEVQSLMKQLFTELKSEMKQVKKQKKSNQKYTNPYKNVQVMDGMYMDKKK